ncbi:FAD-dependent monooxygenase [Aquimarina sp. AD10]|uniref:FAD-dependent oxidoreductase n=1 Tax=Aquimarina TaxID=290174 RepID=UPI000E497C64|nr:MULTISPECIES: NAD(P)/FAD-dependent oxidoreductase [Aquimarina]AXT60763.1 FAD-dependent monooxygenase [Aquimarina sp. AD10]RKM98537.1 FAD-dependent monooxygenase [Aquimarina sp. AD10]
MQTKNIAIIGSGLVGSLLALYLRKREYTVTVFDRRPDIRTIEFSGRSINLAMSVRGWETLDKIGIGDEVRKLAIPMNKRTMHVTGEPIYHQYYGKDGEAISSIPRGILNKKMITLAEEAGAVFRFNEKVWDINLPEAKIYTGETERGEWKEYKYDMIFGCDGAFSRVRHKMQRRSRFNYSQKFLDTGYKELGIPANTDGTHKLDKNSLHIWPRGKFMLIALPNLDGSFTCTLFMPHEGDSSFEKLTNDEAVMQFWKQYFPDTIAIMPTLLEDFKSNPTSALVTMKCYPWTYWDKVALVGDSAHAIVPFYGQGMNAGFEDISILDEIIENEGDKNWEEIFEMYQKSRKPNADAIAELSYRNFIEMSSKTADPEFILRKRIEKQFSQKYPDKWLPLYSRVTFSRRPYSEALNIGDQQAAIMDKVMKLDDIENIWDTEQVEHYILGLLEDKKVIQ